MNDNKSTSTEVSFNPQSNYYKYKLRSCTICQNYALCRDVRIRWSASTTWLDCARVGCIHFVCGDAKVMNEKAKKIKEDYDE